jgi:hypothetical protein
VLIFELDNNKKYLAGGGYKDGNQVSVTPTGNHTGIDRMKSLARARRECRNSLQEIWYPGEMFSASSQSAWKGVYRHSQHHSVDHHESRSYFLS